MLPERRRLFRELDDAMSAVRRTAVTAAPQSAVDEETRRKLGLPLATP